MTEPLRARVIADTETATLAAAEALLHALDVSLADLAHREHVMGVLRGSAPTFAAALERLLKETRRARAARGVRTPRQSFRG